jgi:hypothetical protein
VPLAEEDGSGGDEDERVGAGSEAVLELHVTVHEGQGQPLVSGLASRVHQQPVTVQAMVHRAFSALKGIFNVFFTKKIYFVNIFRQDFLFFSELKRNETDLYRNLQEKYLR